MSEPTSGGARRAWAHRTPDARYWVACSECGPVSDEPLDDYQSADEWAVEHEAAHEEEDARG